MIPERLTAQLLSGPPADSVEAVAHRLLAVQAQDRRGTRLSFRCRSVGLGSVDVDLALSERRSVVITWLNRGTLQLVASEDYWWLHPLTTSQIVTTNRRRLGEEGVSPAQADRGVGVVTDAVVEHGPQTRSELRDRLISAGVPTAGQALVHVLLAASLSGRVVRGPMRGKEQAYVSVRHWLGRPADPLDRPDALARLARRYLAGHGPADAGDLARWAGIALGEARAGLDRIAGELVRVPAGAADLVDLADRGPVAGVPPPRLLGPFDPLLLGWASRQPFTGKHTTVVTTNGIFRPFALVDGRVVATWGLSGGTLRIRLLEPVADAALDALHHEAAAVLRYLGLPERTAVELVAASLTG